MSRVLAVVVVLVAVPALADGPRAVAVLQPAPGASVAGTLRFDPAESGVRVSGKITGLAPGKHGFHVHEFGDCTGEGFASAGSHFNPTAQVHGAPTDAARHVGDMGNLEAGADGSAAVDYVDPHLAFDGPKSILGRGVIVHAKADDLKTQPTGDAGGRVACGVIGATK